MPKAARIPEPSPESPPAVEPEPLTLPASMHAAPADDGPPPVLSTIDWYLPAKRSVVQPFRSDRPQLVGILAVLHVATQLADSDGVVSMSALASAFPQGFAAQAVSQLRLEGFCTWHDDGASVRILSTPLGPWRKVTTR